MNATPEIPGFLDRRIIVWSYSLLNMFRKECPHHGQARYIDKTIKFVDTPQSKWGNDVHEAMNERVGGGKPLPENMRQWEKFATPFDAHRAAGRTILTENWYHIDDQGRACARSAPNKFGHGKLDLVAMQDATAYMLDWKTGGSKYEDPFELEVGAVLLQAKFPSLKKIVGQYAWLKEDRLSKMYDLSNTQATWSEICRVMQQIYKWRGEGEFPKKQSGLCGWCQRWDCEKNTNEDRPSR